MANKKLHGTWLAICLAVVPAWEGMKTVAYRDPVGIPTVCFGETKNVHLGDRYTPEQCKSMLGDRLQEFARGVDRCIHAPMSESRKAAFVSFSYNVGTAAFCNSTLAKRINAGDPKACDELLKWNKTRKGPVMVTLPGLTRRRQEERELCLDNA